jgi:hypothetical protein
MGSEGKPTLSPNPFDDYQIAGRYEEWYAERLYADQCEKRLLGKLLGDQLHDPITINGPLRRAATGQQGRRLAQLATLLLHAPHPRLTTPKPQATTRVPSPRSHAASTSRRISFEYGTMANLLVSGPFASLSKSRPWR